MNVLFVGSTHGLSADASLEQAFAEAGRLLGTAFAKAGHVLVVGSDSPQTLDRYVVEGAALLPGKRRVVVIRPNDDREKTPFAEPRPEWKNLEFQYRRRGNHWAASHVHALSAADVVVLMGGADGTEEVGHIAPALQKPVLCLASFGGSARKQWDLWRTDYRKAGISDDDIALTRESWTSASAEAAVRAVEALNSRNPLRESTMRPKLIMLGSLIVGLGLWVALFLHRLNIDNNVTFFLLLGLSAVLGSGLRTALRFVGPSQGSLSVEDLLAEVTVGLGLAFGLALVYLAGGIVLTGQFISLDAEPNFVRVSITMSLLGLAAAFLLERATEVLRQRLSDIIDSKK